MFDNIGFDTNELVQEAIVNDKKGGMLKKKAVHNKKQGAKQHTLAEYEELANKLYPAQVFSFSAAQDSQTAADVYDVSTFGLPPVVGASKSGGAMTNGMQMVLAAHQHQPISFANLLLEVRKVMLAKKYSQLPSLSTGHQVDLKHTNFRLMNPNPPPDGKPRRRAVIIGINYTGEGAAELEGCVNDAKMQVRWLKNEGWNVDNPDEVRYYTDDPTWTMGEPSAKTIVEAFTWLVKDAGPGWTLFSHFSGHGAQVRDADGDELDGMDETIVPKDFRSAGQITDDVLHKLLVTPLPKGVWYVAVFDCCHSASCLDLPYMFEVNDENAGKLEQATKKNHSAAGSTNPAAAPAALAGGGMDANAISVDGADADGDALLMQANPEFNFEFASKLMSQVMQGGFEAMPEVFDTLLKGKEARVRSKKLQDCCLGLCFGAEAGRHDKKKEEASSNAKPNDPAAKNPVAPANGGVQA